jgi:calcineurin-like phosphoesterase family protein
MHCRQTITCEGWRIVRQSCTTSTWFTADTHFGDAEAIGRFKRPFLRVDEMDEALVAAWNSVVGAQDEVWHLGDFAVDATRQHVSTLLNQLNGRKHLVVGNNDGSRTIGAPEWESVNPYREIDVDGARLVLCHYPFRAWGGRHDIAYNIHGHTHGELAPLPRQMDVGVDVSGFRPVRIATIVAPQVFCAPDPRAF